MAARATAGVQKFRNAFVKKGLETKVTSWFPGHMYKGSEGGKSITIRFHDPLIVLKVPSAGNRLESDGLLQMQSKLASVDCIIEVHDARTFSGRNPDLCNKFYAIKPHILVLNKMDLAEMSHKKAIEEKLRRERAPNVLFTNCKLVEKSGVKEILPMAVDLIQNSEKFCRSFTTDYNIMVVGIPNVGKSSLINRLRNYHLRKKNANPVGANPGVTKSVLFKVKIHDHPSVYLLDTPGIMQPQLKDLETGLRLALCANLHDHLVGEVLIADYLLYWLNKHENFSYVEYLGVPEATDDVRILLLCISKVLNKFLSIRNHEGAIVKVPDWKSCASHFIKAFRSGAFGRICLDDDFIVNENLQV